MIHGPFYPSSVAGWQGSGPYTAQISGEGVTPELVATGFNVSISGSPTVSRVRFVYNGLQNSQGWNLSNAQVVIGGVPGSDNVSQNGNEYSWEDVTLAQVLGSGFGALVSLYSSGDNSFSVNSIALYVETQ